MKAIVALCAAVALSGCAQPGYYGGSPYVAPYYYGYGPTVVPYGYGPFGYDYPGYYFPDVGPASPWAAPWPRPRPRPDGTAANPRTPRPEDGGGGGSGYNPGASNSGSAGGGGSGYVPNQPPQK